MSGWDAIDVTLELWVVAAPVWADTKVDALSILSRFSAYYSAIVVADGGRRLFLSFIEFAC